MKLMKRRELPRLDTHAFGQLSHFFFVDQAYAIDRGQNNGRIEKSQSIRF